MMFSPDWVSFLDAFWPFFFPPPSFRPIPPLLTPLKIFKQLLLWLNRDPHRLSEYIIQINTHLALRTEAKWAVGRCQRLWVGLVNLHAGILHQTGEKESSKWFQPEGRAVANISRHGNKWKGWELWMDGAQGQGRWGGRKNSQGSYVLGITRVAGRGWMNKEATRQPRTQITQSSSVGWKCRKSLSFSTSWLWSSALVLLQ